MISWTALRTSRRIMLEKAKENWLRFKDSEPGHRFKDRYHRRRQSSSGRYDPRMMVSIVVGLLVMAGGIVAVPGPGPGWMIVLLGIGMLAGESKLIARSMDWAEVRLRKLERFVVGLWRASAVGKALIILTILVCGAAPGYGIYRVFFT